MIAERVNFDHAAFRQFLSDYLVYTVKVGELATRYTWASVLLYDDDYRRMQSELSFRWGSDAPHLSTVILKERDSSKLPGKQPFSKVPASTDSSSEKLKFRHCGHFNTGKECPYGQDCKFPHVCSICGRNHSRANHKEDAGKPRATAAE